MTGDVPSSFDCGTNALDQARHFGDAAPMIALLNAHHKRLEAQPLMLAIESDDGLACVERVLKDLSHNTKLPTYAK